MQISQMGDQEKNRHTVLKVPFFAAASLHFIGYQPLIVGLESL